MPSFETLRLALTCPEPESAGTKQPSVEMGETPSASAAPAAMAQQQPATAANDSDDDDIFQGAGKDFEDPVAAAARAREQNGAAPPNGNATGVGLFGSDGRLADLPPGSTTGASHAVLVSDQPRRLGQMPRPHKTKACRDRQPRHSPRCLPLRAC